ncbi:ParB/RepB/Spo0J family partition protein [Embleya sp. MST-111070]|uniref:ParB/RepB/Spo0J family partition protein n=1 Tax=Embleya sp. MST-111070 TaxID=3398231 RepID=UPI003F741670
MTNAVLEHGAQPPVVGVVELNEALQRSERLRQRRFEMLPMRGSVYTDIQGRGPGQSTSAEGLADLISSISTVGVLQAVLVEEIDGPGDVPERRLVVGERRYRACRWGAVNQPDNPRFEMLPAVICPGPISAEERRTWQLVENLAREDLQPGELAAALLLERSAILHSQLVAARIEVVADVLRLEDPAARFQALEKLRGSDADLAAPWTLVLRRLGLQISSRRARELVAAFRTLPREISSEMDEHQVSLAARTNLARLTRGRREAASELWQAVQRLGRPDLLSAVTRAKGQDPALTPDEAVDVALSVRQDANAERAAKLTRDRTAFGEIENSGSGVGSEVEEEGDLERVVVAPDAAAALVSNAREGIDVSPIEESTPVDPDVAEAALAGVRALNGQLAEGRVLHRFDSGSLRMLLAELTGHLDAAASSTGGTR